MILLSLYCNYRKLYSLALGGNSFSITVETTYHSNKLLSSITAFFKHNWRWLHTLLFFIYIYIYIYIYISKEIRVVILLPIMSDKLLLTIPENNMNYLLPYVSTVHDSLLQRLLANNTSNWNYTEQKFPN